MINKYKHKKVILLFPNRVAFEIYKDHRIRYLKMGAVFVPDYASCGVYECMAQSCVNDKEWGCIR